MKRGKSASNNENQNQCSGGKAAEAEGAVRRKRVGGEALTPPLATVGGQPKLPPVPWAAEGAPAPKEKEGRDP